MTAAFGFNLAMQQNRSDRRIYNAFKCLNSARPTAINLEWPCKRVAEKPKFLPSHDRVDAAGNLALELADKDVANNTRIGKFGLDISQNIANKKPNGSPVHIVTHCNAGWLLYLIAAPLPRRFMERWRRGLKSKFG